MKLDGLGKNGTAGAIFTARGARADTDRNNRATFRYTAGTYMLVSKRELRRQGPRRRLLSMNFTRQEQRYAPS